MAKAEYIVKSWKFGTNGAVIWWCGGHYNQIIRALSTIIVQVLNSSNRSIEYAIERVKPSFCRDELLVTVSDKVIDVPTGYLGLMVT